MGTDPAGLQERLEAALDPASVIERELGDGAISRAFLLNDARLGRRTCSSCGRIRWWTSGPTPPSRHISHVEAGRQGRSAALVQPCRRFDTPLNTREAHAGATR